MSIVIASILFSIKFYFYFQSNSIGILASAIDSVFDFMASFITVLAIFSSLKPADSEHRFGHGKAEALSGFTQGLIIILSSLYTMYKAIYRAIHPIKIQAIEMSLVIMMISIILTMILVVYQAHVIRKTSSIAVESDRLHYLSDLLSNLAIIVSLLIIKYTNFIWADMIAGGFVALYLLKAASQILKKSIDILLDKDISDKYKTDVNAFIQANKKLIGYHDLRSRSSGIQDFLEIHLEFDNKMKLEESHDIAEDFIQYFEEKHDKIEIIIHCDPVKINKKTNEKEILDRKAPKFY